MRVVERGGGLAGVRWSDPILVPGADVVVLRQQALHRAAVVAGVAAGAAGLRLVSPGGPVRRRVAQLGQCPSEVLAGAAGDRGEPIDVHDPPVVPGCGALTGSHNSRGCNPCMASEPGEVGGEGFVPGGRDRDRQPRRPHQPAARADVRPLFVTRVVSARSAA